MRLLKTGTKLFVSAFQVGFRLQPRYNHNLVASVSVIFEMHIKAAEGEL